MRHLGWIGLGAALALGVWLLLRPAAEDADEGSTAPRSADAPDPQPTATLAGRGAQASEGAARDAAETAADVAQKAPVRGAGLSLRLTPPPGTPLPASAQVTLQPSGGPGILRTVGPEGRLEEEGFAPGQVQISAVAEGWLSPDPTWADLVAGERTEVEILLERGLPLSGRVVRDADGAPVAGARVLVGEGGEVGEVRWSVSGEIQAETETDADGRFRFPALPLDFGLTLLVDARGFRRALRGFQLAEGPKESALDEVRLEPGGSLVGTVRGPGGERLPQARVEVEPEGGDADWPLAATSDETGRFEVIGLDFDRDHVAVAAAKGVGRSAPARKIRVSAREPVARRDLSLAPPGRLVLEIAGARGEPVRAEAELTAAGEDARTASGEGRVVFEEVDREREYGVLVRAPGHAPLERKVVTVAEPETVVRLALAPGLTITGRVVDDLGSPVAGALLSWHRHRVRADAEGGFRLEGLGPERLHVHVFHGSREAYETHGITPPASDVVLVLPRDCVVELRLVLPAGAAAPTDITVARQRTDGSSSWGNQSWREDGLFRWTLGQGTWLLKAHVPGYMRVVREVVSRPGERIDLGEVRLSQGHRLTGRVVDPSGAPVAGALLETWDADPVSTLTDERGEFVVADLPPGPLTLHASAPGFATGEIEAEVGTGGMPTVLTLFRGGLVRGTVLRADGAGDPDRWVWVEPLREDGPDEEAGVGETTDASGWFEVRVPPGRHRVSAGDGFAPVEVDVPEGGRVEVSIRAR